MFAIGLNGSPRKNGNSEFLLTQFMAELSRLGVHTRVLDVGKFRIEPCREIALCEREGMCAIRDEMSSDIYGLLRRADIVVIASPIFFYGVSAQLKALIDRCQALWARRYMHKILDPGQRTRRGFVLAVGATRGKKLFDGVLLTARYFFDAIGATPSGSLTYRQVETRGQMKEHPTVLTDLAREAQTLAAGLIERPKVLVAGHADSCRGQMAAALLQRHAGERLDVLSAGTEPAAAVDPRMVEVMREIGIDMAYRRPLSLEEALACHPPRWLITTAGGPAPAVGPGVDQLAWEFALPAEPDLEKMRSLRDAIEAKVQAFIARHP